MPGETIKLVAGLRTLRAEVLAGMIKHAPAWNDADVCICRARPPAADPFGFRPTNRYVVTEFQWELSWLFGRIGEAFGPLMQFRTKYVFYGRLADAANRYLRTIEPKKPAARTASGDSSPGPLLLSVLNEADLMAEEVRE